MALISCPECSREISDKAAYCPQCGYPISKYKREKNDKVETLLRDIGSKASKSVEATKEKLDAKISNNRSRETVENKETLAKKRVQTVKVVKRVLISAVVLAVVIWFGMILKDDLYRGEARNIDTDYIEEGFTNVYADVISIEPVHFVYEYKATNSGMTYGDGKFQEVVCRCVTVEGKVFWASFFYHYYPDNNYSTKEGDYTTHTYSKESPYRISGHMKAADRIADNLDNAIGDVLVLDVTDSPEKH